MTDARLAEIRSKYNRGPSSAGDDIRDLLTALDANREAVMVLAKDKVHGVADMIGREVCENAIAHAAIKEQTR